MHAAMQLYVASWILTSLSPATMCRVVKTYSSGEVTCSPALERMFESLKLGANKSQRFETFIKRSHRRPWKFTLISLSCREHLCAIKSCLGDNRGIGRGSSFRSLQTVTSLCSLPIIYSNTSKANGREHHGYLSTLTS